MPPLKPNDDTYLSYLQATIASLRYWVPAISDAAKVEQSEAEGTWQMMVRPLFKAACPFGLTLSRDGGYSLSVDGVCYPEMPVEAFDVFLPMAEAISEGRVVRRIWSSPNTGLVTQVETVIDLGNGKVWSGTSRRPGADAVANVSDSIRQDRHYLPYRRR